MCRTLLNYISNKHICFLWTTSIEFCYKRQTRMNIKKLKLNRHSVSKSLSGTLGNPKNHRQDPLLRVRRQTYYYVKFMASEWQIIPVESQELCRMTSRRHKLTPCCDYKRFIIIKRFYYNKRFIVRHWGYSFWVLLTVRAI